MLKNALSSTILRICKAIAENKVITFAIILLLSFTPAINAATITSTATGGNWNTGSTWIGGNVPLSTDDVVIATTGVNSVTLSAPVTCVSLTINSGAILTPGANLITISGDFSNLGTLTSGSGGLTFTGTATQTISGFSTTGTVSMTKTAGTATFNGNVSGSGLTINGTGGTLNLGTGRTHTFTGVLTLTAGTLEGGSSSLNLSFTGTVVSGTGATFTANTGTVNYSGVAQTLGVLTYNNLTLSGTGAKTFPTGTTTVNGTLSIENGNNTNIFTGTIAYGASAGLRYNVSIARTVSTEWPATFSGSAGVTIDGTGAISLNAAKVLSDGVSLTINSGATLTPGANLMTIGGNFTNSGTLTSGSGGMTINGTGTQSIGGFTTTGTISMTKTAGTATFVGDINGASLTLNGSGGTLNLGAARTHAFTGSMTVTAGTLDGGSANVTLSGNLTVTGTFNGNAANITLIGTTASIAGFTTTGNFIYNKATASTTTVTGNINANNFTMNGGGSTRILNLGVGLSHTFTGTFTRTAGTLDCGSSTITFTQAGTVFSGTGGTFTASTSTIVFSSALDQTLPVVTYNNLTLSGGGIKTFATTPTVNGILSMEGTATVNVTTGVVTYGAAATLRYNTSTARTVSLEEWITPFNGTGGVVIANTGEITLNANRQFGNNTNVPLTINTGATLSTNNFTLTFHGGFINNGTLNAGSSPITMAGTVNAALNIGSFTTTGLVSFTKTAGSVTFTGNVSGAGFILSGTGGTINLGTSLTHTFTGLFTRTNGTLNCNSSTLNLSLNGTVFSGTGGTINANTGTFNYSGAAQTVLSTITYNNLTLSGSGSKTTTSVTVNGILSMEGTASASGAITYGGDATLRYNKTGTSTTSDSEFPTSFNGTGGVVIANTGTVTLNNSKAILFTLTINSGASLDLNAITTHTSNGLILNGVTQVVGTWGTSASGATNTNDVFFAGTGRITVSNSTTVWNAANGTTDWSDPLNWTFGVPTPTLDATISGTAPFQPTLTANAESRDLTINVGASLNTANFQFTFHGDLIQNGTLTMGSSNVIITGIINQSIAGFTTTGNITMTKTAATATFTGNIDIGSLTLNGVGGTLNLGTSLTHSLSGDLTITAGTLNASSSSISLTGTAAQGIAGFTTTGNILMNKTGGTATFNGNIIAVGLTINGTGGTLNLGTGRTHTFSGTWTRTDGTLNGGSSTINFTQTGTMFSGTGGTFTPSTGTVNFSAAGAQTCPALTYNELTVSGSGTKTFSTTPTVNDTLSMQGTATIVVTTGVVTYGPSATLQYSTTTARTVTDEEWISPFTATGGVVIASTGVITLNAAKVFDTGVPLTINTGASLTANTLLVTLGGNFTRNGTFTSTTGGVTITGNAAQTITGFTTTGTVSMTKTGGTASITSAVSTANLTINGSGGTLSLGTGLTHTITGNLAITAGTLNVNNCNITLSGGGTQSIAGFTTTGNITINKTAGTVATFTGDVSAAALTSTLGTLTLGTGRNHTFSGTWTRTAGVLNGGSSTITFSAATAFSGTGTTFNADTSTVVFSGAAQTCPVLTYRKLTLSGSGLKTFATTPTVNDTLTIAGTITISTTITYGGDATLRYNNATSYTTSNNEFPATFSASGGVVLSGAGTVILNGAKTINAQLTINVGAKIDLSTFTHSSLGLELGGVAQPGSVSFGGSSSAATNPDDTYFEATSTGIINNTSATTTWTGATNTNWSLAANWNSGVPTSTQRAIIPNVTNQPTLTADASCSDLTINIGATLTTAGFQLSLFGDFINNGTATFGSSNIIIDGNVTQSIAGFTTTGNVTMLKTGGTATLTSSLDIGNLTLNGTGGTLNLGAAFTHTLRGNLTITAGTLNANSSNITITGTATQSIASFTTTGNVTMTKTSGTATFTGNISMGSLTLNGSGGTLDFGAALTHTIRGDLTITAGILTGNSSNVILTGTAAQSIAGFTTTGNITSTKTGGTATFAGDMSINNLTVNGTGGTVSLGALRTHTLSGNLAITLGTLLGSSSTVNLAGNLTTGGTFTPNSMNIVFTGTGTQSIAAFTTTGNITMTKTGGTVTYAGNVSGATLTLNGVGGTLNLGAAFTHTYTGNVTITAGTLNGNTSTLSVSGNLSNSGTYTGSSSNLTIAGTGTQNIAGFTTLGNVSLTKTGGVATFISAMSAAGLTINGAGGTLNLGTALSHTFSGTVTRTNGTLNLGSSTLNLTASGTVFSGSGGTFTPNTGTVNFGGAAQTVAALTYNNLTLSGSGTKTTTSVIVNGILSLEGTAIVSGVITYGIGSTLRYDKASSYTTTNDEFPATFSGTGGVIVAGTGPIVFNAQKVISNVLNINTGATVDLNSITTHTCGGLTLAGVDQSITGTYGAIGSGAANTSALFVSGTGLIEFLDASTTWTAGAATTDWHDAANWSNGIPSAARNTIIPNIATQPTLTNDAICKSLTINTGATLTSANFQITLNGDFVLNGSIVLGSSPIIIAGTNNQSIAAISTTGNITVTKTGGTATLSGNMSAAGLTISGLGGTLNLGSGLTHTFTGDITRTAGTLTGNSANITITGTASQTIAGFTTTGNISVTKTGGTATLSSNLSANDLVLNGSGGAFSFSSGFTHTFTGNITVTAGTLIGSTSSVILTGTATQSIAGFTTTGNISVTKTGGTATLQGNLSAAALTVNGSGGTLDLGTSLTHTFSGAITLTAGTLNGGSSTINANLTGTAWTGTGSNFVAGTSTVIFGGVAQTLNTATTFNNLTISNSGVKTFTGVPTVNGIFELSGTATASAAPTYGAAATLRYNTNTARNIGPEWITPFTSTGGIIIANTGAITLTAARTLNDNIPLTINASAVLTPGGNLLTLGGDFINNGTLTSGSGGVTINGTGAQSIGGFTTTGNVTMTKTAGTATIIGNLNTGSLILNGSGGTLNLGTTLTHTINGDLTITAGTLTVNDCNITIAGTATQNIAGFTTTGNILLTKTGGTATLASNLNANNLTLNGVGGTLNLGTGLTHTFTGDIALTAGTLNGGSCTINANSTSATAWSGTGSNFTASTSTVNLGGGAQTIATTTTFNNLNLSAAGVKTMEGSVTVSGELAFTTGTSLALGTNTLTLNGTLSNMNSSRVFTANGSSNITIGGSGALGSDLFFDQSTSGTTNRIVNFTYNRASQTITLANALQVTGAITPTAGTLATGGNLRLISNALGDARIGQGSGSYITGNVAVERFIPSVGRRWRFMASPVTASTVEDWRTEIYITGPGTGNTIGTTNSNGFDATANNNPSIFRYDETVTGGQNNGWITPSNTSVTLTPGRGYRVFIRGDRSDLDRLRDLNTTQNAVTIDVVDNPVNTGDINMNPTYTVSGGATNDGWNLMGNPYPSPISWDAFHDAGRSGVFPDFSGTDYAHLDQTVSILNPNIGGAGQYASYNAVSGATVNGLTDGIIPSGAAFFVQAVGASPTMTMREIYKTTAVAPSMFKTSTEQFSITLHRENMVEDETVFKNVPSASINVDAHDIVKLFGGGAQLASITKDGSFMAANYMPLAPLFDTIKLSVAATVSGNYVFKFNDATTLAGDRSIHLIDYKAGNLVNVKTKDNYAFTIDVNDPTSKGVDRFALIIGEIDANALNDVLNENTRTQLVLYPTQTNGTITIQNSKMNLGKTQISVFDINGKEVFSRAIANWDDYSIELDLSNLKAGSYFVKINSEKHSQTLKCIKY